MVRINEQACLDSHGFNNLKTRDQGLRVQSSFPLPNVWLEEQRYREFKQRV